MFNFFLRAAALAVCVASPVALSQTPQAPSLLIEASPADAPPKTIALVSAIGSQLQIVRQLQSVGTSRDPFDRLQMPMPDHSLNNAVLRGLDRAVARIDPRAKRVLLHVDIPAFEHKLQSDRAQAAADALLNALRATPKRQEWDEIIAVTPRYMRTGANGMGAQLWGVGVFVQPLRSGRIEGGLDQDELKSLGEEASTMGLDQEKSDVFVAPYAYFRFTVLDAKTMRVIKTLDRTDNRKLADRRCRSRDLFECYTPEQYALVIDHLTERTGLRGVTGSDGKGQVELSEPRVIPVGVGGGR